MSDEFEAAVGALRDALGAEHAAVWVYGLASAFAEEQRVSSAVDEALAEHERLRDTAEKALHDVQRTPGPAAPAYDVGQEVDDQSSAIQALLTVEHDCQVGWRSVLENAQDPHIRRMALDGLTTTATRATRWRLTIGEQPAAQTFPGQP